MKQIVNTCGLLLALCTTACGQWVACQDVIYVQCPPGGCQPQYYYAPQQYCPPNPKVRPDGVETPPTGSPNTPRFTPQPIPVTPQAPQSNLEPVKPIPQTNDPANVLIISALAKIEARLSAIEGKHGEPGPVGPKGDKGEPGAAGSNADISFQIRVQNPRTGYTTPYATVKNGGKVTLILDPAQLGEK